MQNLPLLVWLGNVLQNSNLMLPNRVYYSESHTAIFWNFPDFSSTGAIGFWLSTSGNFSQKLHCLNICGLLHSVFWHTLFEDECVYFWIGQSVLGACISSALVFCGPVVSGKIVIYRQPEFGVYIGQNWLLKPHHWIIVERKSRVFHQIPFWTCISCMKGSLANPHKKYSNMAGHNSPEMALRLVTISPSMLIP